jgi:hypothetical protein
VCNAQIPTPAESSTLAEYIVDSVEPTGESVQCYIPRRKRKGGREGMQVAKCITCVTCNAAPHTLHRCCVECSGWQRNGTRSTMWKQDMRQWCDTRDHQCSQPITTRRIASVANQTPHPEGLHADCAAVNSICACVHACVCVLCDCTRVRSTPHIPTHPHKCASHQMPGHADVVNQHGDGGRV